MAQQTAVEWLMERLTPYIHYPYGHSSGYDMEDVIEQAKQMEKEQIKNAYKFGLEDEFVIGSEKYYNQTYNVQ